MVAMSNELRVAVVGATGAVGRMITRILEERLRWLRRHEMDYPLLINGSKTPDQVLTSIWPDDPTATTRQPASK